MDIKAIDMAIWLKLCKTNYYIMIYPILKKQEGIRVKKEIKTRLFLESVYFILRTGSQWRELPCFYGKWRSIHKRYEAWCRKGFGI